MDHGRRLRDRGRRRGALDAPLRTELYFAYGSNLDEQQMRVRCPGSRPLFQARLPGHRLDFTHFSTRWQGGTADIVPEPASTVLGLVYEMGDGDFALLDRFEGGYERVRLEVVDDARAAHAVTSYSVRDKGRFPPHATYLGVILRESERLGFPAAYVAELRARYGS